jgi:hypothetical protein
MLGLKKKDERLYPIQYGQVHGLFNNSASYSSGLPLVYHFQVLMTYDWSRCIDSMSHTCIDGLAQLICRLPIYGYIQHDGTTLQSASDCRQRRPPGCRLRIHPQRLLQGSTPSPCTKKTTPPCNEHRRTLAALLKIPRYIYGVDVHVMCMRIVCRG